MPTLRLTQTTAGPDEYRVVARLEDPPGAPEEAGVQFRFALTEADQEDLRWYLEDFLQHPLDPEPKRAARIEARLAEIGQDLFRAVFESGEARDLWAVLRRDLGRTRVEVAVEDPRQATAIPWELLRDPRTDVPLALRAAAFVRTHPRPAQRPALPGLTEAGQRVRILLAICRPWGQSDVPFRSVAGRLIKGLSGEARQLFQLDVLRPPTFEQLSRVLRRAAAEGRPYHIVHFDGHGTYLDAPDAGGLAPTHLMFKGARAGAHGYLLFEDPDRPDNIELVDGVRLGDLLVETGGPVLVLNACRSAHAEAGDESPPKAEDEAPKSEDRPARAFGSLAQEAMDTGLAGVVAMRYNVYVVTAAQFMADLYAALGRGQALGQAVAAGRKQLAADPLRTLAYDPIPLQDWLVPVVYEAAPIELFPQQAEDRTGPSLSLDPSASNLQSPISNLPTPDTGFIGRDETLLALDRAFDREAVVLLQAYAGSGKTATAAEFARWYHLTGGLQGPVLFTSFERPQPLPQVLDELGRAFEGDLAQIGINWLALADEERRAVALQVLAQVPLLWIWDNVEPVAGFPRPEDATLSPAQQAELAAFLRAARETRAKFLLTSRRDERDWLGDLPRRIAIPPMPMQERVQLARALAEKQGRPFTSVQDWRPLLRFSQGNPLTIISLVGQALRGGLASKAQIEDFVRDLQRGAAQVEDEAAQGRAKSLAASLGYGFEHAFDEAERAQLALLHLFQGFV
ncbi:MAG: CHAT domain-containing protein, partial [Anaerolineae bacterium]